MNLAAAFKRIKERDNLPFTLAAVRVLLVINERAGTMGCNAMLISATLGNSNGRTQLKNHICLLLQHGCIYLEEYGRTKKYWVTISGSNLLNELDKELTKTKLKLKQKRISTTR